MKLINGMEFINDDRVIGKWENIGWTERKNGVSVTDLNDQSGEFHTLYFLPDGKAYWIFEGWTKGILLIHYGGNEPILSYRYEVMSSGDEQYLLLKLENKTEVFIKRDCCRYTIDTLGKHDDINKPFVADSQVLGKWRSVAFVSEETDFNEKVEYRDLYLRSLEFFPDGSVVQSYMDDTWHDKWTKGVILNLHRTTAADYHIKEINGSEYLFMEWKMGNYIYGGMKPDIYVFKREK
ncbi:MAG: hypothetical protein IJ571_00070 [Ruminococcus sp.]|nr:hypothetical protein [Ruminococcus sp.]